MNKIYRLVWSRSLRAPVVASELATRSAAGSGRTKAGPHALTTVLTGAVVAMLGVPPDAQAIVGITRKAVGGTTCEANADETNSVWNINNDARCHPQAGTGASGVGDPGTNIIMYSSQGKTGSEDSMTVGGYLDVWKTATFWGGVDMQGNAITNLKPGQNDSDAATFGQVNKVANDLANITNGGGIKYFRANSSQPDAVANNVDAVAVGPSAVADGPYSTAVGVGSKASGHTSLAVGALSEAPAYFSAAFGRAASATGEGSTALGLGAKATTSDAVALGAYSVADRGKAVSVGSSTVQRQIVNVAKGTQDADAVNVSQLKGVTGALGGGASVAGDGSLTAPKYGVGGNTFSNVGDALGNLDGRIAGNTTAINNINGGKGIKYFRANSGQADATAKGADSVAIGPNAVSEGGYSQAMGGNAKSAGDTSIAIGDRATTESVATRAVAVGARTAATAEYTVVLGESATATQAQSVALGAFSVADRANTVSVGSGTNQRQIVNVAKGTLDTDAVNLSQLKGVTAALGGGAGVAADGSVTAPSYSVGGTTYNNVAGALGSLNNAVNGSGGVKYFRANSDAADAKATGVHSVAVGPAAEASGNYSTALGSSSKATGDTALAVGEKAEAAGYRSAAFGRTAGAIGDRSTALGLGAKANQADSVALGAYSVADRANTVAVGSATSQRQVVNVAKGTQDTDAVNLSQLKGVTGALGGGAGVAEDGSVTAPSYGVGGSTFNNVGDALGNLDGRVAGNTTAVNDINGGKGIKYFRANSSNPDAKAAGLNSVAIGPEAVASGAYSQALGSNSLAAGGAALALGDRATVEAAAERGIAVGASATVKGLGGIAIGDGASAGQGEAVALGRGSATAAAVGTASATIADANYAFAGAAPNSTVSIGKVGGERTLTNVAAGRLSGSSTDAVNGSQLYATNQAVSALDDRADAQGQSTAAALGGGAKYDPANGQVGAPTYSVGGKSVTNVGDAITNLGDMINNVSADGLVKQDLTSRDITVGKTTNGKKVDFKGTDGERVLTGVADGAVATGSKDAVNGGQLYNAEKATADALGGGAKVNPDGSVTGPTYTVGGKTVSNVGDALTNVDGRVTSVDGRVTNLGDQINNGEIGLVKQDATSRKITVAKDRDGTQVDFTGTAGSRVLNGVSKGALTATSVEAVNGSQLYGTNKTMADSLGGGSKLNPDGTVAGPTYSVGGKSVTNVGDAITNLGDMINNVSADGLVKQDLTSRDINVGKTTNGKKVDFKGTDGERVLTGVADGSVASGSKDAVTGGQLYNAEKATTDALGGGAKVNPDGSVTGPTYTVGGKTVTNVGDAITNVDGRVTTVDGRVTNLGDQINNGEIGLVQQDATSRKITVAKDRDGTQVDFTGTAGSRVLNGVSKGALTATSVEAVNGSQLYGTNKTMADSLGGGSKLNPDGTVAGPTYSVGGKSVTNVGDAITNLGDMINNVSADGLVKQDLTSRDINVGKTTNGKKVDFKGTDGERVLTGVADGSVASGSKDAVTGGQLYNAEKATTDALGGGAKVNPDGSVTGPTYTVGGKTVTNVGDAITNVDGRVTTVDGRVTNLGDQINNGEIGLVKQDATSRKITVAKDRDGTQVDFTGTAGSRVLNGVSKGALTATSVEAVNGSQLYGTNKTMADSLGGGSKLNPDGTVAGPTYSVGGKSVTNVGDAITNLGDMINNVSADGLVKQDLTSRDITVGKASNGKKVDFKGTDGERVLTGVAEGSVATGSKDAVTGGQLYNAEKATTDALGGGAKVNPDGSITGPTYTVGGKTVTNVGDGLTTVDGRVTNLGDQINNGEIGLVKQDATSRKITVAKDRDGTQVDFTGTAGSRVLSGVSKGALTATSVEAVNGSQLYGTNKAIADSLGGGSKLNPDGTVAGPTYTVGGKNVSTVGDAIDNIDGRVTTIGDTVNTINNGGGIKYFRANSSLADAVASGADSVAIGPQASASAVGSVALGKGAVADRANTVSVGSSTAQRQVVNVAKGTQDTDAVNVSQLKGVTSALGGGAGVAGDGSVLPPSYSVGGKTVGTVGDAITNLGDMINNVSADGLVKQDLTNRDITVGKASNGKKVDFTGTAGSRVLAGVDKGALTATSVEAVNGSQLYGTNKTVADSLGGGSKLNPDGTVAGPTYSVGGKSVTNVGDAITNLGDMINNVSADGLVKQDLTSRDITVGKASNGKKVDFKGTDGERVLTGMADGSVAAGSKDAVTGGQLYNAEKATADALGGGAKVNPDGSITGPSYSVGGKTVSTVGDAIDNIDGRVTTIGDTVNTINNGGGIKYFRANSSLADAVASGADSVAIGPQASASAVGSVALGKGAVADRANTVSVGSSTAQRQVVNVAKGTQDTDAVNVSQLKGVTSALGGGAGVAGDGSVLPPSYSVGGKTVGTVGDAITNLGDMINNVSADGLVKQDLTTRDITVGKATNGKKVDFKGTDGERVLTGVADGAVASGSKDAVNGGQLYNAEKATTDALGGGAKVNPDGSVTGPTYTVGGKTVTNVGDGLTTVDGRVTNLGDQINNGEIGLVQQDATSRKITVAKDRDGALVDFTGTAGSRVLTGVSKGALTATSVEAVNGSQLYGTNKTVADSLGGGSKLNPDGTIAAPTYSVGGKSVTNVGDAITNLGDMINNVSADGLVKQDLTSRDINVGKTSNGKKVDFKGTDGERVLTGVADGSVAAGSKDAVTGGQLYNAEKATADALGGGAKVNPDGSITGPTYTVGGKTVSTVGDAIDNIDGRVTTIGDTVNTINNGGGIKYFRANSSLADAVASGADSVAIGPQASASAVGSVALGKGAVADRANTVSVGSSTAQRQVVNVAKGTQDTDAVNVSQLKGVTDVLGGGSKLNPDGTVAAPTYSVGGKSVTNVGDAITNLGDMINNVSADGLVKQDLTSRDITVGKTSNGKKVDFKGTDGERVLTGVAKGALTATSVEAVNGSQLYATNKTLADSLGGGAKLNPDGSVTGPTYSVGGKTVTNVGDAITNVDGRVTNVDGRVTNVDSRVTQLGDQIVNGEIGLVKQDPTTREVTVAKDSGGKLVNLKGADGERVLTGVADGAVAKGSKDALTGGQFYDGQKATADALGGGAKVNPDGSVTGPTYTVGGKTVTNVGDAITNVDGRVTNLDGRVTNLGDQINNGEIGLVQQDATSRKITVAKGRDGALVDFTGTAGSRVLTGVSKGALTATSVEAVNGSQLYGTNKVVADSLGGGAKLNPDGTVAGPTYNVGGKSVTSVGDAITNLGDMINTVSADNLVKQDPTSRAITVGKTSDGKKVDFKGTDGERVLTGVADGSVAKGSKDAVTGGQLYDGQKSTADALGGGAKVNPDGSITGPTYNIGGKTVSTVGDALTEVDGRVTNVDDRVTNLGDQINNGEIGLVKQDPTSRKVTVAKDTGGKLVDLKGTEGERVLTGVAGGSVAKDSTDAVTGGQLYNAEKATADALGGGAKVDPDGSITGPTYTVGGKTVSTVGDAIDNIDGRVTTIGDTVSNINNGGGIKYFRANSSLADAVASGMDSVAIGPMAAAQAMNAVALGKGAVADRDNTVSVGAAGSERQVVNVAKGTAATDAVNLSQLKPLADALGGGTQVNPDGSVTGPTYNVGGKTVSSVGDAITNLGDMIASGAGNGPTLVEQDGTSRDITVAAKTDGKRVDFRGTEGERVLTGVAKGTVAEGSSDATNGAQLHGVSKSVADALGGGSQVNPDGSVTGPTYNIGGKTVNTVGDALTEVDGRITDNTRLINNISNGGGVKYFRANATGEDAVASGQDALAAGPRATASGQGTVAVGNAARSSGANSVALGAGSVADRDDTVAVGSSGNERTISHVAAGTADTDAVNMSQLKNSQAGSLRYDAPAAGATPDYGSISLGGPGGTGTTVVRNVAAGKSSTDAVNVQQLQDGIGQAVGKANSYTDSRFQQVKQDAWVARREARGGTAAAMAMAGMPQAYLPGANMLSAAVGGYQGEAAMAVGLSGVTDSGRYVYKAQASGNTSGDFGFSVGAGIQW